jgi:glycine cleavage system H protein
MRHNVGNDVPAHIQRENRAMSSVPSGLKYTADNEWVRVEADGSWTVGLTEYAITGDILVIHLPEVGLTVEAGDEIGGAEGGAVFGSAQASLVAPVTGEVVEVNEDTEAGIQDDVYKTWVFKMKPAADASTVTLLDAAAYATLIDENAES